MATIVTHTSPDWDAIGAVWLLLRFGGLADADVVFVNTGQPGDIGSATAVVDTGRELDPLRLRFDHHQLPGAEANECSATSLVFQWLHTDDNRLEYLAPLIDLIYAGDTGRAGYGADTSRMVGIHALLSAWKARGLDDHALLMSGLDTLDTLNDHLRLRAEARAALVGRVVYRSDDGLIVAIKNAPPHATSAAHEMGARLVVFQSDGEATNAIGIMRAGEQQEPHVGRLVQAILDRAPRVFMEQTVATTPQAVQAMIAELQSWFLHNGGFFAGRGTAKAPDPRPIDADLRDIAAAIDAAWKR